MKNKICKNEDCRVEYTPTGKNQKYCRSCGETNEKKKSAEWDKRNYKQYGRLKRIKKYGLTEEQYNQLFADQKGCCAICGKHQTEFSRSLAIDHCHTTEEVRGLLCKDCNLMLGFAKDKVEILLAAIEYLKKE